MSTVGKVESLWRYPVKSMRGEELAEAFFGFAGIYGDRLFAFRSSARPERFPYLTGRELEELLLYRPRFRHPDEAARPSNLTAAEASGLDPLSAAPADLAVEVETPTGEVLDVEDPALLAMLAEQLRDGHALTLLRSEQAMTDCRPVSLFSLQTARQLGDETGTTLDKRRFRGNVYMDLGSGAGFAEDGFVGRTLRVGAKAMGRSPRARPALQDDHLDPETARPSPDLLRKVTRGHDGMAGVYGAVLVEGTVRPVLATLGSDAQCGWQPVQIKRSGSCHARRDRGRWRPGMTREVKHQTPAWTPRA